MFCAGLIKVRPGSGDTMTNTGLKPTVLWAQKGKDLVLTIEAKYVAPSTLKDVLVITEESLAFTGVNAQTQEKYDFSIDLFGRVDPSKTRTMPGDFKILLHLTKTEDKKWPSLTKGPKPFFVKVDFSRFEDSDEDMPKGGFADFGGMEGLDDVDWSKYAAQQESDDDVMPQIKNEEEEDEESK